MFRILSHKSWRYQGKIIGMSESHGTPYSMAAFNYPMNQIHLPSHLHDKHFLSTADVPGSLLEIEMQSST